jgi:hypothetical protein
VKGLPDERIIAIAAADSARRSEIVLSIELHARHTFDHIDQLINGNEFA